MPLIARLLPVFGLPLLLLACADKTSTPDDTGSPTDDTGVIDDDCMMDQDGDGVLYCDDCNDEDDTVYPGADEICDGLDNNCDEDVDEDSTFGTLWYEDADGDGYGDPEVEAQSCSAPIGFIDNSLDCDDSDDEISPAASELCDEVDNDCDGEVDVDAVDQSTWYTDADADGFGDDASSTESCTQPEGTSPFPGDCDDADAAYNPSAEEADCTDPTDYNCDGSTGYTDADGDGFAACEECDDTDASHFPGASETCDLADDDCDGEIDETDAIDAGTWYADTDADGYGDASATTLSCTQPDGYIDNADDCDDTTSTTYPGADETCNSVDDDCDSETDEDATDALAWYDDLDEDGFGDPSAETLSCEQPDGTVADDTDCDDDDPDAWPDAPETCDGFDNDCDGEVDEDDAVDAPDWYTDADADGYGDAGSVTTACDAPDGTVPDDTDCDDADAAISPAADELCDDIDNDCDGETDEDSAVDASVWYTDADEDGFGDPESVSVACSAPASTVTDATDCDDTEAEINPIAEERCDSVDNNCDGETDEDSATDALTFYADADGDSYGDDAVTTEACEVPSGYSEDATDCDDAEADINPGADEYCDGVDNNCDGTADEDTAVDASTWYRDKDRDMYGNSSRTKLACSRPGGYRSKGNDCDDENSAINPGATEICDSVDNDCDGTTDEPDASDASTWYADADEDGYGDAEATTEACTAPSGYGSDDSDCDDADASAYPGADETCDGADNDCDGTTDEASAIDASTWYRDSDGDGHGDPDRSTASCDAPSGYDASGDDCDDTDDSVYPGAVELCDGLDQDCDEVADNDAIDLLTWYYDGDRDGYGDEDSTTESCESPGSRYTMTGGDCDDGLSTVNPGEDEVCEDGLDNDCDGTSNECALDGTAAYTAADALLIGEEASDKAGFAVAGGSDINGDGASDIVVGASGNDRRASSAGAAYVVLGAPSGTVDLSEADGILIGEASSDSAGKAVGAGGDVDGDGYGDILVGAEGNDSGGTSAGIAYLIKGPITGTASLSTADSAFIGEAASDNAGAAVAVLKDVDGDGQDDLAVGAKNHTEGTAKGGGVYILTDPSAGDVTLTTAHGLLYGSVSYDYAFVPASAGDTDGDGLGDLLVGAEGVDDAGSGAGAAYLLLGDISGTLSSAGDSDAELEGEARGDAAGVSVAGAGDTNGDGYEDVMVGAPKADYGSSRDAGGAYIVLGPITSSLSLSAADGLIYGAAKSDGAGTSVAGAGDTDGDGNTDVLVGAPYVDTGGADAGAAYLLLGPVEGTLLLSAANATWDGGAASDNAGYAVFGGGDLDADGHSDLILGIYGADAGGSGSGTTAIILGAGL